MALCHRLVKAEILVPHPAVRQGLFRHRQQVQQRVPGGFFPRQDQLQYRQIEHLIRAEGGRPVAGGLVGKEIVGQMGIQPVQPTLLCLGRQPLHAAPAQVQHTLTDPLSVGREGAQRLGQLIQIQQAPHLPVQLGIYFLFGPLWSFHRVVSSC